MSKKPKHQIRHDRHDIRNFLVCAALCAGVLLFSLGAFASSLDYPTHRRTTSIPIAVSNITVQQTGRASVRGRFGSVDDPVPDIQKYVSARFSPKGQGQALVIKITRASIVNQGRDRFGDGKKHIDITMDVMLTANGMTPTKTARIRYNRYVNDGYAGSNLPIDSSTQVMEDAIKSIDRQLLAAMKNQLGLLR